MIRFLLFLVLLTFEAFGQIRPAPSGGGATLPSGLAGQIPYYAVDGTTVTAGTINTKVGYSLTGTVRFVFEGDSMLAAYSTSMTNSPSGRLFALYGQGGWVYDSNFSVSGDWIDNLQARYTGSVFPRRPAAIGTPAYLVVWAGCNNIRGGETADTAFTKWSNYVTTAKADGFTVVALTSSVRTDNTAAQEIQRVRFNALIRDSALANHTYDVAADLPSPPNTSLYYDYVHLLQAGNEQVAYGINQTLQRGKFNRYPITPGGSLPYSTSSITLNSLSATRLNGNGAWSRDGIPEITSPAVKTRLVFDGDELTLGDNGTNSLPVRVKAWLPNANWLVATNLALTGQTLSGSTTSNTAAINFWAPAGGTNAVLVYGLGSYDLRLLPDPVAFMNTLSNACIAARASGFTVLVTTILDNASTGTGQEYLRAQINSRIRRATFWDYLYDIEADMPTHPNYYFYFHNDYDFSPFGRDRAAESIATLLEMPKFSRWPEYGFRESSATLGTSLKRGVYSSKYSSVVNSTGEMFEQADTLDAYYNLLSGGVWNTYLHIGSGNVNLTTDKVSSLTATELTYSKPIVAPQLTLNSTALTPTTGAVTLDFAGTQIRELGTLTGNVTISSSNLAAGKTTQVWITGHASTMYTVAFPAAWVTMNGLTSPVQVPAGKVGVFTCYSSGTTDAAVRVAWSVQQ